MGGLVSDFSATLPQRQRRRNKSGHGRPISQKISCIGAMLDVCVCDRESDCRGILVFRRFMTVEAIGGWLAGSLAMLGAKHAQSSLPKQRSTGDAAHMMTDAASFAVIHRSVTFLDMTNRARAVGLAQCRLSSRAWRHR